MSKSLINYSTMTMRQIKEAEALRIRRREPPKLTLSVNSIVKLYKATLIGENTEQICGNITVSSFSLVLPGEPITKIPMLNLHLEGHLCNAKSSSCGTRS